MLTKNDEIEALRGLAILFVLFAHLGGVFFAPFRPIIYSEIREYVQPGTGVDLFFCISGFVIMRSLRARQSRDSFRRFALSFWLRRFWRLAPTLWLWGTVGLLVVYLTGDSAYTRDSARDLVATILHFQNLQTWDCMNNYVPPRCGTFPFFWSLSLEEQFYLLFPLAFWFLPRSILATALIAVVSGQLVLVRGFADLLWLVRTDAIGLGVLLAMFVRTKLYLDLRPRVMKSTWLSWSVLGAICFAIATIDAPVPHPVRASIGVVAVLSAILVWLASYDTGYAVKSGRARDALAYIGSRSYGLYVIHIPTALIIRGIQNALGLDNAAGLFGLAIIPTLFILTEINYRFIETPLRHYGRNIALRISRKPETPTIISSVTEL